ncbi:hypothetical protein ABW20_dc0107948 [Dactylellina cionopaga]|nr:hypothetical protein ABW20_dc0107948 [Dactylellina cionopaga]
MEEMWDIGSQIAEGGFAYLRIDRLRQQHNDVFPTKSSRGCRAVKVISKSAPLGWKTWDYMKELNTIAKFSGPQYAENFVKTYGWFEDDKSIYIAMEYHPLGDLGRHIKLERPFSESTASQIIKQITEGVNFMHQNGFTHRDLKPT